MPKGRPNSYSGGGFIKSMREKHEPHMKLAGRVDRLEKDLPISLAELHKTLSKSFGMQRKALLRVMALEKQVSGITIIIEGLEDAAADAVKKPPRKKRPRKKPPKKSAKKPTPKDWDEEVPGDWDSTSGSGDIIPEDEIGGAIDGIDDSVDEIGGADVIDVPADTTSTTSTTSTSVEEIKQETKKIHSTISTLTSHTRTNLSKILGVEKRTESNSKKITLIKNILKSQQSDLAEKLKGLDPVASPLEMSIQSIVDSVKSIHDTLIKQQDLDKGQEDDADIDAEQDKRDAKESSREGGGIGEGLKKTGEKMLAPVKKGFDSIKEWLIKFFAAKAIMMFMNWFSDPANAKKVSSLFRFIKDWWPAILTGMLLFVGSMLGPTGIFIGIGALVVGFIPKILNAIKSLFGFTKDTNKEATKGQKEADKAEKLANKEDKKDVSESLRPDDDVGDTPEPGTQETPGDPVKMNKGGEVPGQGDQDTVPAMLTPGEFVMSKGAVEQYGIQTLEGMNAAAGGTNKPEEGVPLKGGSTQNANGGGAIKPQTPLVRGYKGGGVVAPSEGGGGTDNSMDAIVNMGMNEMKAFYGITNTVAGATGDFETGFKMQTQEELNAENNAKLPLGLKMTPDGQNIDLGKFAGDKARMIGELATDPKFADALKERGEEFGFENMTGEDFKKIADSQADKLQYEINQFIPGTDAHAMAQISDSINFSTQKFKPTGGPSIPGAPTPPTTTVAYQQAQSASQGGGGSASAPNPGGKVPQFSASAKLSPHKVKVLGISR